MSELIPEELRKLKNWGVWKYEKGKNGRLTKVPYQVDGINRASSTNPDTWGTYEEALQIATYVDGLAFFFSDGYFGVDLDHVADDIDKYEDGEKEGIVYEFVDTLKSYAEISPSGEGLHIICKGKLPQGNRRKGNVEMYDYARFFTMTGNALINEDGECYPIQDTTNSVIPLFERYIGYREVLSENSTDDIVSVPEQAIIEFMDKQTDDKFINLFKGKWQNLYPSQSEADMAFCNMLAYRSQGDISMMDAVFRLSELYREKWEREDYRMNTLSNAIASYRENENSYSITISNNKKFSYDDTGNAERFANKYADICRYCFSYKSWLVYDEESNKWLVDNSGYTRRLLNSVVDDIKKEPVSNDDEEKLLFKHYMNSRQSNKKKAALIEAEPLLPVTIDELDKYPMLANLKNGYLDLEKYTFNKSDKELMFTKTLNVEFEPEAECPKWEKFLNEIFLEDEELIEFIQKACGYSLTGSTVEQCMFILHGDGNNGKSLFLETIRSIMGDYAMNMKSDSIMVKQSNSSASGDIARLKGSRFVMTSESNDGVRLDEGLVKSLTGGDIITARHLYKEEIEYKPEFKLWLATNHKPIIRGTDDGIWRRLILIPFNFKVKKVDKFLDKKLAKEKSGILNWMLQGLKKYQKDYNLNIPAICRAEVESYKREMDQISAFIDEKCEIGEHYSVSSNDLYQAYRFWASYNGEHVFSHQKFGREIGKKFGGTRVNSKSQRNYVGLKLK